MLPRTVSQLEIFQGLDELQIRELLGWFWKRNYPAMRIIYKEGDPCEGLFILCRGDVAVVKNSMRGNFRMSSLKAPTFFGEVSFLTRGPHTTTMRAETEVEAGVLPKTFFEERLRQHDPIAMQIVVNLAAICAKRLARADEELALAAGRLARFEREKDKREHHMTVFG